MDIFQAIGSIAMQLFWVLILGTIGIVLVYLIMFYLKEKRMPKLQLSNYNRVVESAMLACPPHLKGAPLFLKNGKKLGSIVGYGEFNTLVSKKIMDEVSVDRSKIRSRMRERLERESGSKREEDKAPEKQVVIVFQESPGILAKMLPMLGKKEAMRLYHNDFEEFSSGIMIKTNVILKMDYFYHAVNDSRAETEHALQIDSETYRELFFLSLEDKIKINRGSLYASPEQVKRVQLKEGFIPQMKDKLSRIGSSDEEDTGEMGP
jgi:hypothetical protein